jgi:hypothetical protein
VARIGSSVFDFHYEARQNEISASITNHNGETFEGVIQLVLPKGAVPVKFEISDESYPTDTVRFKSRYGRPAYVVVRPIVSGRQLKFTIQYRPG